MSEEMPGTILILCVLEEEDNAAVVRLWHGRLYIQAWLGSIARLPRIIDHIIRRGTKYRLVVSPWTVPATVLHSLQLFHPQPLSLEFPVLSSQRIDSEIHKFISNGIFQERQCWESVQKSPTLTAAFAIALPVVSILARLNSRHSLFPDPVYHRIRLIVADLTRASPPKLVTRYTPFQWDPYTPSYVEQKDGTLKILNDIVFFGPLANKPVSSIASLVNTGIIRNMLIFWKNNPGMRHDILFPRFGVTYSMRNVAFWERYSWLLEFPDHMMPPTVPHPTGLQKLIGASTYLSLGNAEIIQKFLVEHPVSTYADLKRVFKWEIDHSSHILGQYIRCIRDVLAQLGYPLGHVPWVHEKVRALSSQVNQKAITTRKFQELVSRPANRPMFSGFAVDPFISLSASQRRGRPPTLHFRDEDDSGSDEVGYSGSSEEWSGDDYFTDSEH